MVPFAIGAAAALASPEEATLHDELARAEATPQTMALADLLAAYYGHRRVESAYRAARSSGVPRGIYDLSLSGPVMVVSAARWGIEDPAFDERVSEAIERSGHARGRALLVQAAGLRALARGEQAKSEALLLDATQSFATLHLEHERALAMADRGRALAGMGRGGEAVAELDEARRIADRLGAVALRATLEAEPVRA